MTLYHGGMTLLLPVKPVIGKMHYRGMEFGGAHVWKMSHPQAMEFFGDKQWIFLEPNTFLP